MSGHILATPVEFWLSMSRRATIATPAELSSTIQIPAHIFAISDRIILKYRSSQSNIRHFRPHIHSTMASRSMDLRASGSILLPDPERRTTFGSPALCIRKLRVHQAPANVRQRCCVAGSENLLDEHSSVPGIYPHRTSRLPSDIGSILSSEGNR